MNTDWQNLLNMALIFFGGAGGKWLLDLFNQKTTQNISENDQALKIYQDMVVKLQVSKDEMEKEFFEQRESDNTKILVMTAELARLNTLIQFCPVPHGGVCPLESNSKTAQLK